MGMFIMMAGYVAVFLAVEAVGIAIGIKTASRR